MQVNDYGNDVLLAEACRGDVDQFCKQVKGGGGRVHACLRTHRAELSSSCRKEELKLEIQETANLELRPTLKRVRVTAFVLRPTKNEFGSLFTPTILQVLGS